MAQAVVTTEPVEVGNGDVRALVILLQGPRAGVLEVLQRVKRVLPTLEGLRATRNALLNGR